MKCDKRPRKKKSPNGLEAPFWFICVVSLLRNSYYLGSQGERKGEGFNDDPVDWKPFGFDPMETLVDPVLIWVNIP